MTLFPASDESLHPRRVKVGKRAAEGLGEFEEFAVIHTTNSALDLGKKCAANVPTSSLTGCSESSLADPASNPQFANLRADDVFGSGGHGCEPRA